MLIFLVMGGFSISALQRETFPEFADKQVEVRVIYPGATAEEVEESLCQRIEDVVEKVNYVEEIRSEAQEGFAKVVITMQEDGDFPTFIDDIKREVEAIKDFPDETEAPIITELGGTSQVISIGVTGPMAPRDLKAYCEELKTRLQREDNISLVSVQGFSDHQIRIRIPTHTLMQFGLSLADIADIITRQSVDMPAGTLETEEQGILLRFTDERRSPEEFHDLSVITSQTGADIRLGDIATIADVFERDEEKLYFNGQRAGLLQITKTEADDVLRVYDAVRDFLKREELRKPPGVNFALTYDMASIVRDRLLLLFKNGWQGLVLVFLTLWLFFNLRFSFWVTMGLPVSFLGALFFLPPMNYTINMISMVGLLIALGLLMDDAIVISENVATHLQKGKTALQAAIDATSEVKAGVISSFLTTVCVFGPLAFLSGNIGRILQVMPVVLILVLGVSLIEGFWILPHHLAHSLRHYDPKQIGRLRRRFEAMIDWTRDVLVGGLADIAVSWRYLFLGVTIAVFILSIGMIPAGFLKFQSFPDMDGNIIEARILLPQGTPLTRTEAVVKHITDALTQVNNEFTPQQPGGQSLVQNVVMQYNTNASAQEQGSHVATIRVDLLAAEKRNGRLDDVMNRWRELVGEIPDVIALNFTEPGLAVAGLPIEVRLFGNDLNAVKEGSLEMQAWLKRFKGVFDITDDLRPGKPEVRIRMRADAVIPGLNARMLATQLRTAYYGTTVTEIQVGSEAFEIDVRLSEQDQNSLADLEYFHITLPGGKQVPLSSVANVETGRGYARVTRIDGQRTVTVQGNLDPNVANAAEIIALLKEEFLPGFEQRHPAVQVSVAGESQESATTAKSLQRGFLIGIAGIFILLSFQFQSYLEPVVVMSAIPFSLIGVIWGHFIMGHQLSMPGIMGFVSLAGIVVNDSILLVEFIKMRQQDGMAIAEAARRASRERFRAVLLTSLTTIAGLLPLLLEKSLQAQVLIPLAISIAFGMMASTFLVLIIVPAFYTILGDFGVTATVKKSKSD